MPTYIHKTDYPPVLFESISPNKMIAAGRDLADYHEGPDLSAVEGVARIYWVVDPVNPVVTEMLQGEKDTVDANLVIAARDAITAQIDDVEDLVRAVVLAVLDELNLHASTTTAILDAIDNGSNLAQVKSDVAAIADLQQRTLAQTRNAIRTKLGLVM